MPTIDNLIEIELEKASAQTGIPKEELVRIISTEFGDGELPRFMRLGNITFSRALIDEITAEFKDALKQKRKDFHKRVSDTFRTILYNLVRCSLTRKALSLPNRQKFYNKGTPYNKIFFTKNSVQVCLQALEPYLNFKRGNIFNHKVNAYTPNKLFQLKLIPLIYSVCEEYNDDTELIIITNTDDESYENIIYTKKELEIRIRSEEEEEDNKYIMEMTSSFPLERTYVQDLQQLLKINNALKKSSFALKAPVKRIYSRGHVMFGGRLYTPLSKLPDRKARIRINTRFNGNPVAEVDLKANHSSMLYALKGKQLPRDFYELIANESGQTRDKVKWLVMKMIGAKDRNISLSADIDEQDYFESTFVMTQDERNLIEGTIKRMFPELYDDFYRDMGVKLQGLEGDILLDAMCELVDQGIVSLPIHDALYVEQQYIEEATKALKAAWTDNLGVSFEPYVDIDRP